MKKILIISLYIYNSPGFEKIQRMMAQTSKTKGITCTAFSENLTRAFSFLANSTMGSYVGKSLDDLCPGDIDDEELLLVACLK